ncbi:MAG: leucine-rich repeat domain-containing protein [Candidatus Roizmanbacteria bacterium]
MKKLFLSHNHLSTLDGLESFKALTHLSISHNKIQDIEEISRI